MSTTLTSAFKELRKFGYFARQNFMCCQNCGWHAVPDGKEDKVVFYHQQDNENKKDGQSFFLAWSGDGEQICDILKRNGVETKWNGNESTRIEVVSW
jgi:hypothetical protein